MSYTASIRSIPKLTGPNKSLNAISHVKALESFLVEPLRPISSYTGKITTPDLCYFIRISMQPLSPRSKVRTSLWFTSLRPDLSSLPDPGYQISPPTSKEILQTYKLLSEMTIYQSINTSNYYRLILTSSAILISSII